MTRRCSPTSVSAAATPWRTRSVSSRALPSAWKWTRATSCRATKTSSTTCGANAACPPTWTPLIHGWTTKWNARACAACSNRSWTAWWATPCRSRRARAGHGCPAPGSCAMSACICSPAIRRWACACRWTRCLGRPRATRPWWRIGIRSTRGAHCRGRPSCWRRNRAPRRVRGRAWDPRRDREQGQEQDLG
ncbi:hypothetical protein D3C87_1385880 [compost metagenome]